MQYAALATQLLSMVEDLRELPGYHPAHDQVVAIAIRPLIEQVFKWQQRLHNAPYMALRLELAVEHIEWFPARFRHILDNLLSNALRYRDPASGESRVTVSVSSGSRGYELRIADNGLGMPESEASAMSELIYRSAPARSAGIGVGLAVVRVLVEQCGGTLEIRSGDGLGTTFVAMLPRYGMSDFLDPHP
jgi:signal transduction histidine kinase